MERIKFLDGLRGIAIFLVIGFHAFSRWPLIVPYGNTYGSFFVFKYGYLGVQLFFLISGFVILMSLEKSTSFFTFIYKRWLRLFPAMLIGTVLIFLTAGFLFERPAGQPNGFSCLPGVLFLHPSWVEKIIGVNIIQLEGAFWSLYVEVRFYLIFGALYFILGKEKAIIVICCFWLLSIIGTTFQVNFLNLLSENLSSVYFGWFASGALAYLFFITQKNKYLILSLLSSLIESYQYKSDLKQLLFTFFILFLFFTPIYINKTRILYTNFFLLFLGYISYPLYLIHENAMIALICKTSKLFQIPGFFLPLLPIIILTTIAYFVAKVLEPLVRKFLIKMFFLLRS